MQEVKAGDPLTDHPGVETSKIKLHKIPALSNDAAAASATMAEAGSKS